MLRVLGTLAAVALGAVAAHATDVHAFDGHVHQVDVAVATGIREVRLSSTNPDPSPAQSIGPLGSARLLIGVKSAVLGGLSNRQTIRQTWANPVHRPQGVSVVFLGCEPDWTTTARDSNASRRALDDERAAYGDLLTHELHCHDSYYTLVEKVKGFFRWVHDQPLEATRTLAYVMVTDDDVYVDVPALMTMLFGSSGLQSPPRRRFYGGQVIQKQYDIVLRPLRELHERNYVPFDVYPLSEKPHFATGAHYLLSIDLVRFLGRNSKYLQGVGTLEDVSVGFWLGSLLGVHPVHIPQFDNVRFTLCHNALVAFADLSELAMHSMYENQRHNRPLCAGFLASDWDKRDRRFKTQLPQLGLTGDVRRIRTLLYEWDVQLDTASSTLQIVTTISTEEEGTDKAAVVYYVPAGDSFDAYCRQVLYVLADTMPTTRIPPGFCLDHRSQLATLLMSEALLHPSLKHVYALAQGNLQEDANSLAVFVVLTPRASKARIFVECLVSSAFPGMSLAVLETADHAQRFYGIPPDLIVATSTEGNLTGWNNDTQVIPRAILFRSVYDTAVSSPSSCRQGPSPRTIEISSFIEHPPCHGRHLYIPIASQSFARRYKHTPTALLQPISSAEGERRRSILLSCSHERSAVASTSTEVLRQALENENLAVEHDTFCETGDPRLPLDEEVTRFTKHKFVIVIEDRLTVPGHISHQIVSAFLAGAVPIYLGHSATARWIFNSRAFVDCEAMTSTLRDCAALVRRLTDDPVRYDAMRNAPAVANESVFSDLFSWHPAVAERVEHQELLTERLRAQILAA